VTTTSSGKGLEFDIVLLLGADEGKMPHFGSVGDQESWTRTGESSTFP